MGTTDALARLRRPEYTGEHRCTPCTVVNAAITVVLAAAVAAVVPLGPVGAALVGAGVLAVGAAAIYLRGYLVPGTPRLTRTYLPDRVLRYFEHGPPPGAVDEEVDPVAVLERAGAVTECEDVDDLCLTDAFRDAWYDRMDDLRGTDASPAALATVLDVDVEALAFDEFGEALVALADAEALDGVAGTGRVRVGLWESQGAYLADMAGAGVLAERDAGWAAFSPVQRGQVLNGLRLFLERCPTCDGPVSLGEETVQSCCRSVDVVAVTCDVCSARLFEAEVDAAA